MAKDWRLAILALYGAFVLWIMVHMGQPDGIGWWLTSIPFMVWALAPVALLCLLRSHPIAHGIGAIAVAALGAYFYIETAFLAAPDAQAGLIFLFAPVVQLGLAILWFGAVYLWAKVAGRK